MGTVAYLVDKYLWHSIHPRLPRLLGLRQLFVDVSTSQFVEDVHKVLCAAAAAPPFMPSIKVAGVRTVDGGYVDNAPLPAQDEQQRHRTLVLLTRFILSCHKYFSGKEELIYNLATRFQCRRGTAPTKRRSMPPSSMV